MRTSSSLAFDDQRIDHGEALPLGVDDDRVEVDFGDQIGMIGGETRQCRHQLGQGGAVGGWCAAPPAMPRATAPASALWVISGDCTLSATALPIRVAAAIASSALVTSASGGRETP